MSDLIRKDIQALKAYHVADPGDMIKLDAMENPYSMPEALIDEWLAVLKKAEINRYPDPTAASLSALLVSYMGVPQNKTSDISILLGNGSDELIQMIAMAVSQPGRKIMAPDPGFVMYRMIATFMAMDYLGVPLAEDFSLDMPAMLKAIKTHQPAVIFLAYPNNPTGNLFNESDIIEILNAAEGLVVVDEAYHPFACTSFMSKLGDYDRLLVMRTVSKMGLAGLRLGLLAGPSKWLSEIDKVRLPYNINILTQVSAEFVLNHSDVFEQQAAIIREQRQWLFDQLSEFSNFKAFPSHANFILMRVLEGDATEIFECLKQQGVLIKNMHSAGGALTQCLRLTVGAPEENQALMSALRKCVSD